MSGPTKITMPTARRLAIRAQGLDGTWKLPPGKEGASRAVERLGYVQVDTISVVARAHHHVLWSRCRGYAPGMLLDLQAKDRRVFEYWRRAASYLPMSDYRYYVPRMRGSARSGRHRGWLDANAKLVKGVLARIRKEGPLASADFEAPPGRKRGPWWDWKPAKRALEILFDSGRLMVTERRNFQRVYDLTERVLPPGTDTSAPTAKELARFELRRALAAHGVASAGEARWSRGGGKAAAEALEDLTASGEVVRLEIDGLEDGPYYALSKDLAAAKKHRRRGKPLHILSPFDNLVMERGRLRRLFDGFECKLECYFPAAKRRWGYFCLPILWGDRFIGRLDPKADRKAKTLLVRKLMFEPGFRDHEEAMPALAAKLMDFAAFNGCERVVVEATRPAKVRPRLRRELRDGV
ncbi:MAG: winged helix-turn-helix domain-containing protein [Planctomycetota bacterium]|jgi:uncharacterized protein YcaQ